MKRLLISLLLAVVFYLPAAASQIDTLPKPDFSKYPKVSILDPQFKSPAVFINKAAPNPSALPQIVRLKYDPDIYQLKKNLSQDLYYLQIQNRNNELRSLLTGLLTTFIKQ